MNRKLSLLGISLSTLLLVLISCSSGNKENADGTSSDIAEATTDANDQALADSATGDISQDPALSGDSSQMTEGGAPADENFKSEPSPESEFTAEGAPSEVPPADPLAENAPPADGATPPPADANAAATTEPPPAPEVAQGEAPATPPSDQSAGDLFGSTAATTEPSASEPAAPSGFETPAEPKPKKSGIAHIKLKPFKKGGQLLNTVYIAREGDTLDSISEKLFAANKIKDLKKANPALKSGVKTGDKVYFNSPNRPEDNEKMMTVYEDQGLPPSTYVTKEGDTLKSLAMEWYGSEGSYKEIYSINHNLSSTKNLPPETELTYWPATANVIAYNNGHKDEAVAQNTLPPPPEAPAPATAVMPPMPPPPVPGAQPGAQPGAAMGQANNMAPPPPMPDLNAPPLPPPPSTIKKKSSAPELDKDAIFMIGGVAALLICGGALIAIRKKGGRRNQGVTQI